MDRIIIKWTVFAFLGLLFCSCTPKYPQVANLTKDTREKTDRDLSLEKRLANYQALNTIYMKRKPMIRPLRWNKPITVEIVSGKKAPDEEFLQMIESGLSAIRKSTGLIVIQKNYYHFDPELIVIYLPRAEIVHLDRYISMNYRARPDSAAVTDIHLSGNQYSNPEYVKISHWLNLLRAMAENRNPVRGFHQKVHTETLCSVYLAPHFIDDSMIDKALLVIPRDMKTNPKKRCLMSALFRSMGMIRGYYPSPFHAYDAPMMGNCVTGLYPARFEKQLLSLGPGILNQEEGYEEFTKQDKWMLRLHYHEKPQ